MKKIWNEKKMRASKEIWPKSSKQLVAYIKKLSEGEHSYGTCVYAMSLAAVATFHFMSHKLGVTGFQAGCADMDILRRTRNYKHGFMIIDYGNLLYPQYDDIEHYPTREYLIQENIKWLGKEAKKSLQDSETAHPEVRAWWERLVLLAKNKED